MKNFIEVNLLDECNGSVLVNVENIFCVKQAEDDHAIIMLKAPYRRPIDKYDAPGYYPLFVKESYCDIKDLMHAALS